VRERIYGKRSKSSKRERIEKEREQEIHEEKRKGEEVERKLEMGKR
jgi:hypothetical protein